jgi:predicted molibdopterin-dependent oxidoreductase YjgC
VIGLRKYRGRLTEPLVRENGTLRPASWDEALDFAAAGLSRARTQDTTRSFGMFSCSKASNEVNFQIVKVTSPDDHDITRGNLCIKGRFGFQHVSPKTGPPGGA